MFDGYIIVIIVFLMSIRYVACAEVDITAGYHCGEDINGSKYAQNIFSSDDRPLFPSQLVYNM